MRIADVVGDKLISCSLDTPIFEVAKLMDEQGVGAVLVLEERKPKGIVTDRDLAIRCVAKRLDVELGTVEEVMTPVVETIQETESIFNAIRAMKNAAVRRIVVIDEAGVATRLLSFDDLFTFVAEEMNDLKDLIEPLDRKIEENAA